MSIKKIFMFLSISICIISLNSCILKLPFQVAGDIVDDVTPF